ncbi:hypothetical protein Pmani_022931 [Petrolisthes manimaculis]|uniref:RING-type domain-containing protein n=1 Tax=Petrolisthes manimaculis TaxID=1843537 RepID=A0AAE1PDD1_9EUCA|nr:hypothetical protein Pmani_022931 [Petrolisthes manimaculis]
MGPLRRVKLTELNAHLVCVLCSGYFVDATTIIECLHTFCKTCIVRYLQTSSFCPICEVQVHKTKPLLSLREDRTLQDVVFKLVPGLFHSEMMRRSGFYKEHPEAGGDKTEQTLREQGHFFHVDDQISLSLEYLPTTTPTPTQQQQHHHNLPHLNSHVIKPLKVNNGQQEKQKQGTDDKVTDGKEGIKREGESEEKEVNGVKVVHKRYLRCPAAVQVSHLEKFIRLKYSLSSVTHKVDIMHGEDCLVGELTLLDVVYMYKWTEDAPLRLLYTVSATPHSRKRPRLNGTQALVANDVDAPASKVQKIQNSTPEDNSKSALPVSQAKAKGQDFIKEEVRMSTTGQVSELCNDEKVSKVALEQPQITTSHSVFTAKPSNIMPANTHVSIQSLPNTCFTNVSVKSSTAQISSLGPGPTPSRGRPALTTTTPSTTTPRVALAHMPPTPVIPTSHTTSPVALPVGGLPSNGTISTSSSTTQTSATISSMTNVKVPISQPLMNGVMEGAMKQVRIPAPHPNKMPHPIIPTKPRLGRPPNSSRINAANMRPPAPRLGDIRNTRPQLTATKKPPPQAGLMGRGNQIVSASLNLQSGVSNVNGPPGKLGAGNAKVPVKRPNELLRETEQTVETSEVNNKAIKLTSAPPLPSPIHGNQQKITTQPISSSSPIQGTVPLTQGNKTTVKHQGLQPLQRPAEKQTDQSLKNTQVNQRPGNQSNVRPNIQGSGTQPSGQQTVQRPPATQVTQQTPSNAVTQARPSGTSITPRTTTVGQTTQVNQRQHQPNYQNQGNLLQSNSHMTQHSQMGKVPLQSTGIQPQNLQAGNNTSQKPMSTVNQRTGGQRMSLNTVVQRSVTGSSSRAPGSPAPHQQPPRPASTPVPNRPPGSPAPHRPSSSPVPHRPPSNPPPQRPSSSPAPHRSASNSPAPYHPPGSSAPHSPANSSPAPHRPANSSPAPHRAGNSSPAPHRAINSSPAPHRAGNSSPAPHRPASNSPAPHRPASNSPAPHRPANSSPAPHRPLTSSPPLQRPPTSSPPLHRPPSSPAPHRPPSSPAPHRPPSSPAPHRANNSSPAPHRPPPSSPAPHRQTGNTTTTTTPRPNTSQQTSYITGTTTTPSPRSLPSPSSQTTPVNKESGGVLHPVGIATTTPNSSINLPNGKPTGTKLGMNSSSQGKTASPNTNTTLKTSFSKTPSPAATKASPKSPGRNRSTSNSSTILSIAQTLANKKLQQRTTAPPTSTVNTTISTSIATTQVGTNSGLTSTTPETTVYPGNVSNALVSPAFAAAAYMASAYADPSAALTDVNTITNLITLSQAAASIRELNLAAMVRAAETIPRPPDPAPIDLSPTCKAAPQNPMTNGRPHTSVASTTSGTKTTSSSTTKSPSKNSRTSDSTSSTTISPPTPEVTITKLPNAPPSTSSSSSSSSTGTGKSTFGSTKMGTTNTNTVSITKRPASNNRIPITKSPANASVRQIPNPSFLRHQSEARNNNNVSKSVPSTSSSSLVTNTTTKNHTSKQQHAGSGVRTTGNSPLKETGPLPETSSILKIEHLTRSLTAPATTTTAAPATATTSHGIRFFDDR